MDRVAVYAGTRNIYQQMYTSLKSLLIHNRMDRVYLMIEDKQFPFPLPEKVRTVQVFDTLFPAGSANSTSQYSYMDMMRCALGTIFEDEGRMLWLDDDVIVKDDITELFDLDMTDYLVAATAEPQNCNRLFRYVNVGVAMHNLDLMRMRGTEDEMIWQLNHRKFGWPGQDAINICCQGRILEFGSEFNSCPWVNPCRHPKVVHYAAIADFTDKRDYKKYEAMEMPME